MKSNALVVDDQLAQSLHDEAGSGITSSEGEVTSESHLVRLLRPAVLLRAEGAALFAAATVFYARGDGSWWLFALAFFLPDLSMVGYAARTRVGAAMYNAFHSTVLSLPVLVFGVVAGQSVVASVALIWLAHIGFDRLVGYGLKYPDGFKQTHLARV